MNIEKLAKDVWDVLLQGCRIIAGETTPKKVENYEIQHTINGINYVMIEMPIVPDSQKLFMDKLKQFRCIVQKMTVVSGWILPKYINATILVPEAYIIEFMDHKIKKHENETTQKTKNTFCYYASCTR